MTTHILRLFSFCIIGTLVLLASIAPQQSRAQLVVSDPGATGVLVLDQVQQANQTFTSIYDNLKEFALDALAFNLASMLSQQLTQQIINWANTGFDGNPFYVNDLGLYFQDISRNQFNSVIQNAQLNQNPFIRSIVRGQFRGIDSGAGAPTLAEQFGVSVDDIFVDITPFGWDALQSIHRPQNNIIASTLAITGERAAREVAEKELATLDLMGANFRSDTACLVTNIQRQYRTTEFIGESFTGTGSSFRARDFREGLILETADGGTVLAECLVSNTNTPSSLIQQQVDRALAEPLERTKIPTEFQQIIASSFSNLVNTFVNRGIQAATSRMSPAQPSSTRGPLSPLENLLNDISAEEAQNNQDDWSGSSFIVIDLLAELDGVPLLDPITGAPTGQFVRPGAITLAEQELALINQMLEEINTTFVALQSLDRCIPGPDFGWESRLRNSLQNKARMRRASNSNANRNQAAVAQVEFAVEMLIPVIQREMRGSATESTFVFGTTIPSADIFMQEIDQTANVRNLNTRLETERGRVSETLVALRTMRQKYTDPSTTEAEKSNIRYGFTQLTTTPSPQAVAQRQNMLEGMRAMQQSIAEKQLRCEAEVAQKAQSNPAWGRLYLNSINSTQNGDENDQLFCLALPIQDAYQGWETKSALEFLAGPFRGVMVSRQSNGQIQSSFPLGRHVPSFLDSSIDCSSDGDDCQDGRLRLSLDCSEFYRSSLSSYKSFVN